MSTENSKDHDLTLEEALEMMDEGEPAELVSPPTEFGSWRVVGLSGTQQETGSSTHIGRSGSMADDPDQDDLLVASAS